MFNKVTGLWIRYLVVSSLCISAHAEQGVVVLNVTMIPPKALSGFEIGPTGDGAAGMVDQNGKARIRVAPQTKVGSTIKLKIQRPTGYAFLSPFTDEIVVPSFENTSNAIDVLIVERGAKLALEDGRVLFNSVSESSKAAPQAPVKKAAIRSPFILGFAQVAVTSPSGTASTGLLGASAVSLVGDPVLEKLGFTREEMRRAFDNWRADALAWKVLVNLREMDGVTDPFSRVRSDIGGIMFGLGAWDTLFGNLQQEFVAFRKADRARFDAIMGTELKNVLEWMRTPVPETLPATRKLMQEEGYKLKEDWAQRFNELGRHGAFQRVQLDHVRGAVDRSVTLAGAAGLRSERAIGFIHRAYFDMHLDNDEHWKNAANLRDVFAKAVGRAPDEQEMMMLLANSFKSELDTESEKRFGKKLRGSLHGNLLVYAIGAGVDTRNKKAVTLEQFGLGMRDIRTGQDVPLSGDKKIFRRLSDGWLPGGKG